jgi:hypothetical protein
MRRLNPLVTRFIVQHNKSLGLYVRGMMQFQVTAAGILLAVKVRPKTVMRAHKILCDQDGRTVVEVAVPVLPERGLANKAVIKLLADALGLPKTAITLQSGATARHKLFLLHGNPAVLTRKLTAWLTPDVE